MAGLLLLNGANVTSSGTVKNDPDGKPDPIAHK
jgi:subtilisin